MDIISILSIILIIIFIKELKNFNKNDYKLKNVTKLHYDLQRFVT